MSTSVGIGHFNDESLGFVTEVRYSLKLNEKTGLTPSINFVYNGINFQTFPRLGITKNIRTRKGNYNRLTFGSQIHEIDIIGRPKNPDNIFTDGKVRVSPFLKFQTPIIRLFKERYNGGQSNKLLTEFIIDVTPLSINVGIGIRKRI
jgi:hypothetical protein